MKISRTRPPDSRVERQIVMGMVVSTSFLSDVKPLYSPAGFNIDYARDVASWCMEYFEKYKTAPGKNIEEIFHSHVNSMRDEEVELISEFLLSISEEFESEGELNTDYLLDNAEKHFRLTSLHNHRRELGELLTAGRLQEAEAAAAGYKRPTRPTSEGVDPITDIAVIADGMREDRRDGMFSLPGALGNMVGDFHRGYLVGILAAPSVGKTWWLQQIALKAIFKGYNVLFVSMEMSKDQMVRRIQHSLTGYPLRRFSGDLLIPVFDCKKNQDDSCRKTERVCNLGVIREGSKIDFEAASKRYIPCTACREHEDYKERKNYFYAIWQKKINREEMTVKNTIAKAKKIIKNKVLRGNKLRLTQYPAQTLTISALKAYLHNLEYYEGFIPDVLITDYAQKFASDEKGEPRHKIRDIWDGHKSIAQEKNILVVSGSQTSAARTGRDATRGDWGESIAPLELCDIGYILNQTADEKAEGLMRVGIAKQRHEEYELASQARVLYSYKIGKPYLDSYCGK